MLDDDQGVASLFKNAHELKDGEGPADLKLLKPAVQSAEDGRVVAADVEDLVGLRVEVGLRA